MGWRAMKWIRSAGLLLAFGAASAQAQEAPAIDLAAVEARIARCRETPFEADLAASLARYGVTSLSGEAEDPTVGLAVSKRIETSFSPARSAEAIAAYLAGNGGAEGLRETIAYYVLKDMALYREFNCQSIEYRYRQVVIFADLAGQAETDDPNLGYYRQAEAAGRRALASVLRARERLAEKEAALAGVLGLEAGE